MKNKAGIPAGTPEWHAARAQGIGASDAGSVLGLNPYKSVLRLWGEKTGRLTPPNLDDNPNVQRGVALETPIAEAFCKQTGIAIEPCGLLFQADPPYEFILATPDFLMPTQSDGWIPIEIKSPSAYNRKLWESPPAMYAAQVRQQMFVLGAPYGILVAGFSDKKGNITEIVSHYIDPLDGAEHEDVLLELERFWLDVQNDAMPMTPSKDTGAALDDLYPDELKGKSITLPMSANALHQQLEDTNEALARYTTERDLLRASLKAMIGDAESARLQDGSATYFWKRQDRKGYEVAPSSSRVLRVKKD
jgi:putative phage-type endonuclease